MNTHYMEDENGEEVEIPYKIMGSFIPASRHYPGEDPEITILGDLPETLSEEKIIESILEEHREPNYDDEYEDYDEDY